MPFTPKLTYKGKPLVRKDNELYYGCMTDPYVLYLQIQSTKTWAVWMWQTRSICSCSLPMSPSPVRPAWHVRPPRTACTMRWTSADLAAEGKRERLNPNANRKLLKGTAPAWSGPFFAVQIFCVMRNFVVYLS